MIKKQETKYINSNIVNVFHFLELKESHTFLIGSSNIRNILYNNDYDLNENINTTSTKAILTHVYDEFLSMFKTAYENPDYYIIDFKCGMHGDEPIRWSYDDMKKGYVSIDNRSISFEECLLHDNNKIKMDLCYVLNGLFTDINCLYLFHIVAKKNDLKKEKKTINTEMIKTLQEEIKELQKEGLYYKMLKRSFSLSMLKGKVNKDILKIINSDYGMFYKFISMLTFVVEVLDQTFKPIDISLVKSNLEYIKQFGSNITEFDIDNILDKLIMIIKMPKKKMLLALQDLIMSCEKYLNDLVK